MSSIAGDAPLSREQFKRLLALVESDDNPHAPLGDAGRAAGRWQMHPEFVDDYFPDESMRGTWDTVFSRTLDGFLDRELGGEIDPVRLAMAFHLGKRAFSRGEWDVVYETRVRSKLPQI